MPSVVSSDLTAVDYSNHEDDSRQLGESEMAGTAALVQPDPHAVAHSNELGEEAFPPPNVTLPKGTTIIMEPLTVLFCIAFQGLGPLISQYAYDRIGAEMGLPAANASQGGSTARCNASDRYSGANATDSLYKLTQMVQDRTSTLILYRDVAAAAGAAISTPLLSSASDRVGRRIAVIVPCAGSLAESIVTLSVIYFALPLESILFAAFASGLCGGLGCLFAGSLAYLADITPLRERAMRITLLEALTGLGGAGACVLIGWWIRWQGYLIPHAFCTVVYFAAAAFCVFIVPEVRQPAVTSSSSSSVSAGGGRLSRAVWQVVSDPVRGLGSLMRRQHGLPLVYGLVFGGTFMFCAAFYGTIDLTVLYSMNYPFCLDSVLIGYLSACKQFVLQMGMVAIVWVAHPTVSTLSIASLGLASTAVSNVLQAVAWDRTILWVGVAAALAAGCPVPMYRSFLSVVTPADKQGCVFSAFGVLQMVAYLLGNLGFTYGYKSTLMWQPGFVFFTVAAVLVAGLLLTVAAELVYRLRTRTATAKTAKTLPVVDGHPIDASIQGTMGDM